MSADARFDRAFSHAPVLPLNSGTRYVLFSDCHRGAGTSGDNFLKNQHLYFAALRHYFDHDYVYIELGDGDELWENRSLAQIKECHSNTFWLLSRFYAENRMHMLYGNHDMVKKYPRFARCSCSSYPCPACEEAELFPGITFHEGLTLETPEPFPNLFLTHGHQGDFLNSVLWRLSRFLVRYIWKPLEQAGVLDPTSAAKNNVKKGKLEQTGTEWAKTRGVVLITGHTHRPMTGSPSSPFFNTGSCVHPRCITCLELNGLSIILVKWTLAVRADSTLYVSREELTEPIPLHIFKRIPECA